MKTNNFKHFPNDDPELALYMNPFKYGLLYAELTVHEPTTLFGKGSLQNLSGGQKKYQTLLCVI